MAHKDDALSAVLEEHGLDAYALFWLIIEHIGSRMEKDRMTPELINSELKWSQILYTSVRRFRTISNSLAEKGLIVCECTDNRIRISIPNIVKYKDEYSKKSGQAQESKADTDRDIDRKQNKTSSVGKEATPISSTSKISQEFEEDWPQFWARIAKGDASKAYEKARKLVDRETLMRAVVEQGPILVRDAANQGRGVLHPATWLNGKRWEDEAQTAVATINSRARGQPVDRKAKAQMEFLERAVREQQRGLNG
jgi:hypothetical protein